MKQEGRTCKCWYITLLYQINTPLNVFFRVKVGLRPVPALLVKRRGKAGCLIYGTEMSSLSYHVFSSGPALTPVHVHAPLQAAVLHPAGHPFPSPRYKLQVRVQLEAPVPISHDICGRHTHADLHPVSQPVHPHFLGKETPSAALQHGPLPVVCWLGLTDSDNRGHWSEEMIRAQNWLNDLQGRVQERESGAKELSASHLIKE